jgi:CheY-like chemotaxis protein
MSEPSSYRVLIVEDEALISMLLDDMVKDLGFQVVGPALKLKHALALSAHERIDVALLDINLGDSAVYPIADLLTERGIPFVFSTAYDSGVIPARFQAITVLQKPFSSQELGDALQSLIRGSGARHHLQMRDHIKRCLRKIPKNIQPLT